MRILFILLFAICQFGFSQTGGGYNPPSVSQSINVSDSAWGLSGNNGTIQASNFIGTKDNIGLTFRTNNSQRLTILNTGSVGVGTTNPTSTLQVNGSFSEVVTVVTATTSLNDFQNKVVLNNGATAITITLPNALTCIGRKYEFSRYAGSTGTVTIVGTSSQIQALAGTVGATTTL